MPGKSSQGTQPGEVPGQGQPPHLEPGELPRPLPRLRPAGQYSKDGPAHLTGCGITNKSSGPISEGPLIALRKTAGSLPPKGNGSEWQGWLAVRVLSGCSQSKLKTSARGPGSQRKDSVPVTELSASGPFESHDLLRNGFTCVRNELLPRRPLGLSETNFQLNQEKINVSTLRNAQGPCAPLKVQVGVKAVQQARRLPSLPGSSLSLGVLRGHDDTIGSEDIPNDPSPSELMGGPHTMVEYKRGLLQCSVLIVEMERLHRVYYYRLSFYYSCMCTILKVLTHEKKNGENRKR
ncbi:LOW QUALITY PROTEIN: uncharacterized protein LOC114489160 [Phyllostomus discolor]|uniref:LOW QUALITY PROTEIN: uncharacterized protein LOC114489160 n=1 Tax=Phyllostomus discolor TaxID=89673 RepID=A0A6J2L048_9CHIR|nr:LOW QUALITY PROTEIN: uncharacterized protein LOC114489160 [Phyllostomus discolor]